jgi:hypothetical protein
VTSGNTRRVLPRHAFPVEASIEPPLTGGSAGHRRDRRDDEPGTAMEPAKRREHQEGPGLWRSRHRAVMEPAADRREHILGMIITVDPAYRPQWSPPWIGGNTGR